MQTKLNEKGDTRAKSPKSKASPKKKNKKKKKDKYDDEYGSEEETKEQKPASEYVNMEVLE